MKVPFLFSVMTGGIESGKVLNQRLAEVAQDKGMALCVGSQRAAVENEEFKVLVRWKNFTADCNRNYKKCVGTPFITQVLADGGVYPCSQFFKDPDYMYGSLHEKSFSDIIFGNKAKQVSRKIEEEVDVSKCISY